MRKFFADNPKTIRCINLLLYCPIFRSINPNGYNEAIVLAGNDKEMRVRIPRYTSNRKDVHTLARKVGTLGCHLALERTWIR